MTFSPEGAAVPRTGDGDAAGHSRGRLLVGSIVVGIAVGAAFACWDRMSNEFLSPDFHLDFLRYVLMGCAGGISGYLARALWDWAFRAYPRDIGDEIVLIVCGALAGAVGSKVGFVLYVVSYVIVDGNGEHLGSFPLFGFFMLGDSAPGALASVAWMLSVLGLDANRRRARAGSDN